VQSFDECVQRDLHRWLRIDVVTDRLRFDVVRVHVLVLPREWPESLRDSAITSSAFMLSRCRRRSNAPTRKVHAPTGPDLCAPRAHRWIHTSAAAVRAPRSECRRGLHRGQRLISAGNRAGACIGKFSTRAASGCHRVRHRHPAVAEQAARAGRHAESSVRPSDEGCVHRERRCLIVEPRACHESAARRASASPSASVAPAR
jgi:hypothetical protein